jgi:hypothetical protein
MEIYEEKYEKCFVLCRRRSEDGRWFILRYVHQYYVKTISKVEVFNGRSSVISDWILIPGRIYDKEELTLRTLRGDKVYLKSDEL